MWRDKEKTRDGVSAGKRKSEREKHIAKKVTDIRQLKEISDENSNKTPQILIYGRAKKNIYSVCSLMTFESVANRRWKKHTEID